MVEKITDRKVMSSLEQNVAFMNQMLPVSESFDIIRRDIEIGGKKSSFYFIDGFTKDDTMQKLMTSLMGINRYDMPEDATTFSQRYIPYVEVDILGDFDQVLRNVLSGVSCFFVEGYEACIAVDLSLIHI